MLNEIIKLFCSTKSPVTVLNDLKKKYAAEIIERYLVYRTVKHFEETGTVTNCRHRNSGRPKSIRRAENIAEF